MTFNLINRFIKPFSVKDKNKNSKNKEFSLTFKMPVLNKFVLFLIFTISVLIRLFSVIEYEGVIHEYDPWFCYRVTKYISKHGMRKFLQWYDYKSWHPYGRHMGKSTYYALMWTASTIHRLLNLLGFSISLLRVCVFFAPFVSGCTALMVYLIAAETWSDSAGLFAAALAAASPGYISRSVAGAFDYEAIAIFAMTLAFYTWLRASKTGSFLWGVLAGVAYFYMVASWGGYIFVLNLVAVHVFVLFILGCYNIRTYTAYSIFYVLGLILTHYVPIVLDSGYWTKSMHFPALGIFILIQFTEIGKIIYKNRHKFSKKICFFISIASLFVLTIVAMIFFKFGMGFGLTGRLIQLLGLKHGINLVSSISEHQKASWQNYLIDINFVLYLLPLGVAMVIFHFNNERCFILLYLFFSAFFSYTMVRCMIVFSPIACIFGGIAISGGINAIFNIPNKIKSFPFRIFLRTVALLLSTIIISIFLTYIKHCIKASLNYYSSPTIILQSTYRGEKHIIDDYREGYAWLRHNTPRSSNVLSWWDYGYQITGMSKRTVYVDNNTRNHTHIQWAGMVLGSPEEDAYKELIKANVDYILVVFGGKIGYSSDDINKAYWIIKIASDVYPQIKPISNLYFSHKTGEPFHDSILFKMCYYRFNQINSNGYDVTRKMRIFPEDIRFKYLEEAYTTKNWMIRIYRVKKPNEL